MTEFVAPMAWAIEQAAQALVSLALEAGDPTLAQWALGELAPDPAGSEGPELPRSTPSGLPTACLYDSGFVFPAGLEPADEDRS